MPILKHLTRKGKNGSSPLLRYIFRYIYNPEKSTLVTQANPFLIRHNIRSRSIAGYIKEFDAVETNRIHTRGSKQTSVHHSILSWSAKDTQHITEEIISDITRHYIKLHVPECLVVGTVHRDRQHLHVHLAISSTRLNGKACRVSKAGFAKIKEELNEYQRTKFPQLKHSLPQHGRKREGNIYTVISSDKRLSKKCQLQNEIKKIQSESKSLKDFLQTLITRGFQPYFRGKEQCMLGVKVADRKYRLKTLGIDPKDLVQHFSCIERDRQTLADIKKMRTKMNSLEKDSVMELSKEEDAMFFEKKRREGNGEPSPYHAINRQEPRIVR